MSDEGEKMDKDINAEIEKATADLTAERNERCLPIANEVIKMMAQVVIEDIPAQELADKNKELVLKIMNVYLDKGVRLSDVNYIHRLILASYDVVNTTITDSLNKHLNSSGDIFWQQFCGKNIDEITVKDLDNLLVKDKEDKE